MQHDQQAANQRPIFIRQLEVLRRTGLSRSTLYDLIAADRFPRPIKLSDRINCWPESEIHQWMDGRIAERNARIVEHCTRGN